MFKESLLNPAAAVAFNNQPQSSSRMNLVKSESVLVLSLDEMRLLSTWRCINKQWSESCY